MSWCTHEQGVHKDEHFEQNRLHDIMHQIHEATGL